MKSFLTGILKESNSDYSMVRAVTLVCLILVVIVTAVILYLAVIAQPVILGVAPNQSVIPADTKVIDTLIYLDLGLLTLSTGIKAFQKFAERETNSEGRVQQ